MTLCCAWFTQANAQFYSNTQPPPPTLSAASPVSSEVVGVSPPPPNYVALPPSPPASAPVPTPHFAPTYIYSPPSPVSQPVYQPSSQPSYQPSYYQSGYRASYQPAPLAPLPATSVEPAPGANIPVSTPVAAAAVTSSASGSSFYQSKNNIALPDYSYTLPNKPPAQPATSVDLLTHKGFDVGVQVSSYRYQEHVDSDEEFMHLTGAKFGATLDGTVLLPYNFFALADFRLAYGSDSYWSQPTGNIGNYGDDFIGEARFLAGKDFLISNDARPKPFIGISPYLGFGYRYLSNTPKGDNGGYRRISQYLYLPLGATERFRVDDDIRLSLNNELDLLVRGDQDSDLNQVNPLLPDIHNTQDAGIGFRGSLMAEWHDWAFGPFFNYWNINESKPTTFLCTSGNSLAECSSVEPHNQTIEWGAQLRYHF